MQLHDTISCPKDNNDNISYREKLIKNSLDELHGAIFQRPPEISAVKKELRVRKI